MKLNISKGKQKSAIRLILYGPEGIGKSTFASQMPDPLFLDLEGGTKQLDVARVEPDGQWTWDALIEVVDEIIADPSVCKTLVIDTVDRAEMLLTAKILEENKVDTIEKVGGGYGKGYTLLAERFNKDLLLRLDRLIAKGVNVTMLAHAMMRKFESPDDQPYDRWELKTSKKIAPLSKEWTDILIFATYSQLIVEENGKNKAKGKAKRVMITNHRPTCDAKNRFGLEDGLPLSFEPLAEIYEGNTPAKKEKTQLEIDTPNEGIVEEVGEDIRDVLLRRLEEQEIDRKTFEKWAIKSGRLAPDGIYMDLSGSMAQSMIDNIETLANTIKGGKKK